MRIFGTALTREFTATGGIALAALSAIILVTLVVRILGKAALGSIENDAVLPFIGFGLMHFLPVLLSLALFIGVFLTLSRAWQDNEMVIWQMAGLSPLAWLRPILRFALPVTLVIALLSLVIIPWAAQKRDIYERYLSTRDEVSSLKPGVFIEAGQGKRVFFVEEMDEEARRVKNVFIQSEQNGRQGIIVATDGAIESIAGNDRFLVLRNGRRYEGMPGTADYRMMEFERYAVRLGAAPVSDLADYPRNRSTLALLSDPNPANMAEWTWRLGYPISALLLALFAVPASYMNPRANRSVNIIFAMFVYTAYSNLIGLSEAWVRQERMSASASLLAVHGSMALLLALLYWQRTRSGTGKGLAP